MHLLLYWSVGQLAQWHFFFLHYTWLTKQKGTCLQSTQYLTFLWQYNMFACLKIILFQKLWKELPLLKITHNYILHWYCAKTFHINFENISHSSYILLCQQRNTACGLLQDWRSPDSISDLRNNFKQQNYFAARQFHICFRKFPSHLTQKYYPIQFLLSVNLQASKKSTTLLPCSNVYIYISFQLLQPGKSKQSSLSSLSLGHFQGLSIYQGP